MTSAPRATAVLTRAGRLTEPGLRTALDMLPAPLDRMANYHFGWCDAEGNTTDTGWGKGLRAGLTTAAAEACGAAPEAAAPMAVAIELLHNFSLVHDDVLDTDHIRRGRPTIWARWGVPAAICLGDALHAGGIQVLVRELPGDHAAAAVARLESVVVELSWGQYTDCAFDGRTAVKVSEYLAMTAGKTGALMGAACALGAASAEADPATVAAFDAFGSTLGLAFQVVDDLLGVWGDPTVTGKAAGNDLIARKWSYPVAAALESGTTAARELSRLYHSDTTITSAGAARIAALMSDAGIDRQARRFAAQQAETAIAALPDHVIADDLIALTELVVRRDR
ncbi:polyprenyl synthetase family protein [Nocardia rhamnosiphila]